MKKLSIACFACCLLAVACRNSTSQTQHQPTTSTVPAQKPGGSDPLRLFTSDEKSKALHDCLDNANPKDPLGLFAETAEQSTARKACMNKYGGTKK